MLYKYHECAEMEEIENEENSHSYTFPDVYINPHYPEQWNIEFNEYGCKIIFCPFCGVKLDSTHITFSMK